MCHRDRAYRPCSSISRIRLRLRLRVVRRAVTYAVHSCGVLRRRWQSRMLSSRLTNCSYGVAGLAGERFGQAEVDAECVGGTVGTGLVGEGEPLPLVGAGFRGGAPGSVGVRVVEQGIDQDGAGVPALLRSLGVGAQQGRRLHAFVLPAVGCSRGGAQLPIGGQGAASTEVVPAQGDRFGKSARPRVAVTEIVDESGIDVGEVPDVPEGALRPAQGLLGASCGVQLPGDDQVGVAGRREVGRVHRDHCVDVAARLGQALHQVFFGPARAADSTPACATASLGPQASSLRRSVEKQSHGRPAPARVIAAVATDRERGNPATQSDHRRPDSSLPSDGCWGIPCQLVADSPQFERTASSAAAGRSATPSPRKMIHQHGTGGEVGSRIRPGRSGP